MTSLLLLTPDPAAAAAIEAAAAMRHIESRVVSTFETAKEWLSMHSYDLLLVDILAEPYRGLDLLELGWKYSATLTAGIFAADRLPPDTWSATLLGAKVFIGPKYLERIKEFLSSFPEKVQLAAGNHSAVLLVEDLDSPRDIIASYIRSLGFDHVDAVGGAKAALEKLAIHPSLYFCVVTDIHMPQVNGLQLTEKIRNDPSFKDIPVVILTADPTSENVIAGVRAGASGFLAKPPKKKTLLRELERARRMVLFGQSPRLCDPSDIHLLERSLEKTDSGTS